VIGVDTHKDVHVAVALAPNGGQLGEHRIPTTRKGYDDLIVWSEEFGSYPVYAIEGTSSYKAFEPRIYTTQRGAARRLVLIGWNMSLYSLKAKRTQKQKTRRHLVPPFKSTNFADIAWKSGQLNTGNAPACRAPPPAH
jgi:hypothetical protein